MSITRRNRAIFPSVSFPIALIGFLLGADRIAALSSSDYTYNLLKFVVFLPDRFASFKDAAIGLRRRLSDASTACVSIAGAIPCAKSILPQSCNLGRPGGLLVKPGRCDLQEIRGLSIIAQIIVRPRQVKINVRLI